MNKYTIVAEYPDGQLWIDEIELKLGADHELAAAAEAVVGLLHPELKIIVMFDGPCPDIVARRDDW